MEQTNKKLLYYQYIIDTFEDDYVQLNNTIELNGMEYK